MNDQRNSNNGMNDDDNQNIIDDPLLSLSLQQLLDHLNCCNSRNCYLQILHEAFQRQLQGDPLQILQMVGCIAHVCQWYEILHLIFQGLQNNSSDGSLVDGLRLLHSHYLDFLCLVTDLTVAHF